MATIVWIALRDSPALIAYHIAGPYGDIREGDALGNVLYWVGSLLHWIYFNYVAFLCLVMTVVMTEVIIASTLVLKMIRSALYLPPDLLYHCA